MPTTCRSEAESSTIMMVLAMVLPVLASKMPGSEERHAGARRCRRGRVSAAATAAVRDALVGHRVAAFQLAQQRAGVDRLQRAVKLEVLPAFGQQNRQPFDALAHMRHALAHAVLELELHERLDDLGL